MILALVLLITGESEEDTKRIKNYWASLAKLEKGGKRAARKYKCTGRWALALETWRNMRFASLLYVASDYFHVLFVNYVVRFFGVVRKSPLSCLFYGFSTPLPLG